MKAIKRWTTTLSSSFDWVISQVENHEALVSTAIREMQIAAGNAQVQLARVKKDGISMRERSGHLRLTILQWEERALASQIESEEKALECIRRKRRCERELQQLELSVTQHAKLEVQLSQDLQTIRNRIDELKRKKNELAAREYRAQAARAGASDDLGIINELDDIFDRWESRVTAVETYSVPLDSLEEEFIIEEEERELRDELTQLRSKSQ